MDSNKERVETLRKQIKDFPLQPGVYLMKDEQKKIIYIGKAVKLRNRVRSYFSGEKDIKTRTLVHQIHSIDHIVTKSEYEALLLENNLIKKWNPRYNINLKDGKSYPVIRITSDEYPRVFRTRNIVNDKSQYYGPYPDVKVLDETLALIKKMLPLRRCRKLKKRENPCLYYHMGKCSGPCAGLISKEDYRTLVNKARAILTGRTVGLEKDLLKEIKVLSESLEFEKAAELRDILIALQLLQTEQKVEDFEEESRDYVGVDSSGNYYSFVVFQMRNGKLLGKESFRSEYYGSEQDATQEFLLRYYGTPDKDFPSRVFLSLKDRSLIQDYLNREVRGADKMVLELPRSKRDQAVLNMAVENARSDLARKLQDMGNIPALEDLQMVLNLKKLPRRIEGFDIAQLDGHFTVSSLISFKDGNPDRKNYRHYNIRSLDGGIDDFKAISEAVARRYTRLKNEKKEMPDLILIDGGKGQVSAAVSILDALGLEIPLIGLAKREELIYLPGEKEPIDLPEGDRGLRVLQHVRDETHRFATSHNQKLRKKQISLNSLENIPGIGPAKSKKLLVGFGSMEKLYAAKAEEISNTAGVSLEAAEMIRQYLSRKEKAEEP
ncbi:MULTISPECIES: excinuclease ABC subunit UvrC [unclassified Oceanispirochaeta]|uniref:excinuclease ABC subunit UvrC n=1 Tax=unclassified Oceanispirochaeta TaxID=2635722 RepID=UPI000E09006D|nr:MULTISPECIES: excinuclease ABC subunit UvrC [unclassified Oceanispirochaeta]MBF9015218.1 excinuclease ABC subunit UvrC [Oceanispirochaeta sp. M2]NPD71676.1 excinuclease ABC subunit UvrC [Oceanispirochaeta sp. M1]RDG32873.1 excinuclease ABC subunit UvrC [Oceanispirochaeta sp. M1]